MGYSIIKKERPRPSPILWNCNSHIFLWRHRERRQHRTTSTTSHKLPGKSRIPTQNWFQWTWKYNKIIEVPGWDKISSECLGHLPNKIIEALTEVINSNWNIIQKFGKWWPSLSFQNPRPEIPAELTTNKPTRNHCEDRWKTNPLQT